MTTRAVILFAVAVTVLAALGGAPPAAAGDRVPFPTVAKGKGEACVRETTFMRENHMELLLHEREETMHEGIRSRRESLVQCLSCHAVAGVDGRPVGADDPKHFCRTCHDYAAVRIDCFECHTSRPADGLRTAVAPVAGQGALVPRGAAN